MKTKNIMVIFLLSLFIFFCYHNFNWFPEKERKNVTLEIYYTSGRVVTKTFNLPKSTEIHLIINSSKSNLKSIWYCNSKPFGMENGYLAIGVEDFRILENEN